MRPAVSVAGCGRWGRNLVRNFARLRALRTVCDPDPAAREHVAREYPDVRVVDDLDEILADDETAAVVVATPAEKHHRHAKAALQAGKDVLVEKPLALEYSRGQELVRLAEAGGRILMVGHVLEYHPAVVALRELIGRGELGDIWYLYSNRLNLGRVRREENILWSFAPHDISVILRLVGSDPRAIRATGSTHLQDGIFDVTTTNLEFDGNVNAHIFVSWLHPFKEQKLVVIGEDKMAVFDDTVGEGKLKLHDKGIDWREGAPVARHTSETTLYLSDDEPLQLECAHFLESIEERTPPLTDGASGLRVLRVLAACQRSLEEGGRTVALDEIEAG